MGRPPKQLPLFGDGGFKKFPHWRCTRVQRGARAALAAAGAEPPSFALRALAEEQARLRLLRSAARRAALGKTGRRSKLSAVEYLVSPAGARVRRAVEACVTRIETLETTLRCA